MFMTRLCSSVVLVILALITLLVGGNVLLAALFLISLTACYELCRACGVLLEEPNGTGRRGNALLLVGFLGTAACYGALLAPDTETVFLPVILFTLAAYMFVYVFTFPRYQAPQIMAAFFSFVYGPVMFSFIYRTRELPYGGYIVWMIFISSWICDSCAYLAGILLGKHKLAPRLSPKKSVEGAIGGVLGAALVGGLYGHFVVERVITEQNVTWIFVGISAVGAVISQVGDLAASAIKRNHDIKDYGRLIPGHGGIMDRFDSVIFTAPMIYVLARILMRG